MAVSQVWHCLFFLLPLLFGGGSVDGKVEHRIALAEMKREELGELRISWVSEHELTLEGREMVRKSFPIL